MVLQKFRAFPFQNPSQALIILLYASCVKLSSLEKTAVFMGLG
jgi:hypothetical protein